MVDAVLDNELPLEELKKMNEEMFSTSFFYDEDEKVKTPEEIKAEEDALIENLNKSVDELDISVWFQNCLNNANIKYIGELVQKSEDDILQMMKFQTKRDTNDQLKELKELLSDLRLTLGMQLDSWTAPN
jgi:DNA-directed RNA polymerase subunit alpha